MYFYLACLALSAPTEAAPTYELPVLEPVYAPTSPAPALLGSDTGFSWTYVEADYVWTDIDALDDTLDGWLAKASLELPLNIFLQASYGQTTGDTDLNETRVGAGWHFGLMDTVDAFGILSYVYEDVSGSGFDDTEDGIVGEIGARLFLGEKLELNGEVIWADIAESDTGFGLGARYYIIPALSLGANGTWIDSNDTYAVGARFQF